MRTRTDRTGLGSTSAWLWALCTLCILVLSLGTVRAADPASSGVVVEERDATSTALSLSMETPVSAAQAAQNPDAPDVVGCPLTVLPGGTGTSGNSRAPNPNFLAGRAVWLITPAEAAANGLISGTAVGGMGFHYTTSPSSAATGTLKLYLENTSDTTFSKSTTFATAIGTMTLVHNSATTTLPASTTPFDITFSGGAGFTYTGGGLYAAFDWSFAGPARTGTVVDCNTTLLSGLEGANSAAAILTASDFRPLTRLTPLVGVAHDASVDFVISYGSLVQPQVGTQAVQAVITNKGTSGLVSLPVTLNLTGAETFSNVQTIASLTACGGQATVTFAPFTPSAIGSDVVTVSVPNDDFNANNSKNRPLNETYSLYSFKYPGTTLDGGVGLNGATGAFVGKFNTTVATKITAVNLEFAAAGATAYRVAIYADSGSGTPGAQLYVDGADRSVLAAGPVTIPVGAISVGPGNFFAGIQQTNTINTSLSFDTEVPVRVGKFYLSTPLPVSTWTDFAPGNNFKLNIGINLQCTTAAACNDNNPCTDDSCDPTLGCVHTNNNANACSDGNSCTGPDFCSNGTCVGGPNPCNDNNACTNDICDGQGGCSYTAVNCDDSNVCTNDSCNPATGCLHANNNNACSDGNPCTLGDVCSGGLCLPGATPSPVHLCNNGTITIPTVGAATPYPAAITVAGQASYLCSLTVDLANFTHTFPSDVDILLSHLAGPNSLLMVDVGGSTPITNVNLTLSDAAASFLPAVGPIVSGTFKPTNLGAFAFPAPAPAPTGGSALAAFTGTNPNGAWNLWVDDQFSPDGGSFSAWCVNLVSVCTGAADCDDANPCTDDACVGGACTHTNNTNPCNDGSACTANDTCTGGVCVGGAPPSCDDGNACTTNFCNPGTGLCENPAIVCNDNNTCTDDTCNPATGCVFTVNDNNACTDNNLCTSPDVCQNGVCVGQNPVFCAPDANVCTTEACNPATGLCASTNNTNPCDDGNACTTGDACGPKFTENFDAEIAPSLPATWTTGVTGTGNPWTTVSTSSDTAPNSAFGFDGAAVADEVLITPAINITSASATLTFRNRFTLESTFEGGVLEISIGGGGFTDIVLAGGSFVSGGYTGVISTLWMNPLAGRSAWTGISAGYPAYLTTVVNLPAAAAGQTIQLQWRVGTDSSVSSVGQNIDSIVLLDGTNTCNPGTAISCDDANPCTDDFCDSITGCQHSNNTEPCDDNNACTILDACDSGSCGGTTIVCDDSNPCTTDSCTPASGCIFAPIAVSPETQNVTAAADKKTYTWSPAPFATEYDAVRGSLGALPVGPGGGDETCFDNLPGPTFTDPDPDPTPGTGYWYLSRGENACGVGGTYGFQGVHGAPGAPRITSTCP